MNTLTAKEQREEKYTLLVNRDRATRAAKRRTMTGLVILAIVISLIAGFTAVSVSGTMSKQTAKIQALENILAGLTSKESQEFTSLREEIKDLNSQVRQRDEEISEIVIDNNVIKVLMEDLKTTNEVLMNEYMTRE